MNSDVVFLLKRACYVSIWTSDWLDNCLLIAAIRYEPEQFPAWLSDLCLIWSCFLSFLSPHSAHRKKTLIHLISINCPSPFISRPLWASSQHSKTLTWLLENKPVFGPDPDFWVPGLWIYLSVPEQNVGADQTWLCLCELSLNYFSDLALYSWKMALKTPLWNYEYVVMPSVFTNASAVFQNSIIIMC